MKYILENMKITEMVKSMDKAYRKSEISDICEENN